MREKLNLASSYLLLCIHSTSKRYEHMLWLTRYSKHGPTRAFSRKALKHRPT